jgi:hypothetical protein
LRALSVLVRAQVLALCPLPAQNVAELAKYVVFARACLVRWSLLVHVAAVVAWALLLSLLVQSVQAKVAFHLASHTPLMFLAELTLAKQCVLRVAVLLVLAEETLAICMCMSLSRNIHDSLAKKMTSFAHFH